MTTPANPVGWFEIYVQDMARAKAFYEGLFGVKLERLGLPEPEMWAFPWGSESPGCGGALVHMPGKESGGGGTIVYFSCADCGSSGRKAVELGGRLERDRFSIGPYGFIAFVLDPDGNRIGLHSGI